MDTVLLLSKLHPHEVDLLLKEFPQLLFLTMSELAFRKPLPNQWKDVKIIYGNILEKEDLLLAPSLTWIHTTTPHLDHLNLQEINKKGNIIVTKTPDENINQIGEFVIGAILLFAKNFIHWFQSDQFPQLLWESKWGENMWTLKGKTLLQIGLGKIGTEIARQAQQFGITVWGMDAAKTFHPHCKKTFAFSDLHAVLPIADIVSLSLPPQHEFNGIFGDADIAHMKNDVILSVIGSHTILDAEALLKFDQANKFRGILIDTSSSTPIPLHSPLWSLKQKIITPEASPLPKSREHEAFRLFVYNLRQYVHGNFKDFRGRVFH